MADKDAVKNAEAALADLEKHQHAAATANFKAQRALTLMHMHGDDKEAAAKYKTEYEGFEAARLAALKAHADSGVTERDIAIAAQAVLDARGEAHTETNILPPNHGIRTVTAESDLAEAMRNNKPAPIKAAKAALEEANKSDAADLRSHVIAGHGRTIALLEESA